MQMGMDHNSKKQIQKQLKKPDLYEEEKIERKIETLRWMGRRSPLLWW